MGEFHDIDCVRYVDFERLIADHGFDVMEQVVVGFDRQGLECPLHDVNGYVAGYLDAVEKAGFTLLRQDVSRAFDVGHLLLPLSRITERS